MPSLFLPPWTIVETKSPNGTNAGSFQIVSGAGVSLAYVYYDDGDPVRAGARGLMTRDEARRIAANIAKLPGLLGAGGGS